LSDGAILGRYWLPEADVRKRAASRGAGPIWKSWPLEMAQKTAIKWACARGLVPIESVELDSALAADTRAEVQPAPRVEVSRPAIAPPSAVFAAPEPEPMPEPEEVEAVVIDAPDPFKVS